MTVLLTTARIPETLLVNLTHQLKFGIEVYDPFTSVETG